MSMIPLHSAKKIFQQLDDSQVKNMSQDAKEYLIEKMQEFGQNLTKNGITVSQSNGRKTLFAKDLKQALDSVENILKNLPRA